ncbi:MAG TPA: anthranilate phosphoribosyltransferase [Thermoanaerobaculia bacterium]|nr:anthranilate phosphoribosyltransferase [Thermoanaerobaculia bacterium]
MTPDVAEALKVVAARRALPRDLAERVFGDLMDGQATEAQKGAILIGIATRGESADEIAGAVVALRNRMRRVATSRAPLLDTCGPGGIGRDMFNLSTATAIVAAGAGAAVAKHGNRSISSRVGSADVLAAAGVSIDLDPDRAGRVLDDIGLVFLFAPAFHPAMKELGTVRRELGVRTIFNALGPLANPAGAKRQMIGVGRPELVRLLGEALAMLGCERAVVFHSANGLDELIPGVPATGIEVREGWTRPWKYDPAELGQEPVDVSELAGGDAVANAGMLEALLHGEKGARREAALLNAALGLVVTGLAEALDEGFERARSAVDEGRALAAFERLKTASAEP